MGGGAACTGFAQAFCEVGWFSPLIWFGLGYFYRRVWDHALIAQSQLAQVLAPAGVFLLIIGICQQLTSMMLQFVYIFLPLLIIYRTSRTSFSPEDMYEGDYPRKMPA